MTQKPTLIILNGTSSAGKSSVANYIVSKKSYKFTCLSWDDFTELIPENERKTDEHKRKLTVLYRKPAYKLLENAQNVIMDIVCIPSKTFKELVSDFSAYNVITVRLKASTETLAIREVKREEDRLKGMAAEQFYTMYSQEQHPPYDLEFDSEVLSSEEIGDIILQNLNS